MPYIITWGDEMTREGVEKAMLFLQSWREAGHLGEQCMSAVAFALRNRQRASWEGGNWMKIVENANRIRYNNTAPNQGYPDMRDPIINRFLSRIDGIYDGSTPDIYTTTTHPTEGPRTGKYWANLGDITDKRFLELIVRCPRSHPKTSTVGTLTFFS